MSSTQLLKKFSWTLKKIEGEISIREIEAIKAAKIGRQNKIERIKLHKTRKIETRIFNLNNRLYSIRFDLIRLNCNSLY